MGAFVLILLCFFGHGYHALFVDYNEDIFQTTSDLPSVINETEISRDDDGHCTFQIKKLKTVMIQVPYVDTETYYGRCPGYYFRKCLRERQVMKSRTNHEIREINETVTRCCNGYVKNESQDKCQPICDQYCVYGSCTAPNVCTCYEDYIPTIMPNICEPMCVGCAHGTCFAPSECLCNPGYNWDASLSECVPVCDGMCHNGKCISPEKCECNAGYTHHATISVCIPHCNETCVNGVCSGANKCECNYGYRFKNGSQTECEPICTDSCKNAKCVSPNVCECENGYEKMDENKPHECHCGQYCVEIDGQCHCLDDDDRLNGDVIRNNMSTICTANTCQNGRCITRHDCECYDGFEKDENSNCVASIEMCIDDPSDCKGDEVKTCNCINGICASNNTCICVNGFKMSEGHSDVCEPACNMNCVNGYCINPDQCECDTGYRWSYNESESHICHPICDSDVDDENGCINGTCIAPDTCQCYDGFKHSVESKFTCEYDPRASVESAHPIVNMPKWTIPAVIVTVFIVAIVLGIIYFNKKQNSTV